MEFRFEIMYISSIRNFGDFIFARLIESGSNFQLKEGATFGGIPVCHYVETPRLLDENGKPRFDVFVFRPLNLERLQTDHFVKGQQVKLITPD